MSSSQPRIAEPPTPGAVGTHGPVLLLSPHMDDAVLGASAVALNIPCEVWTVFSGFPQPPLTTSWDISCGFADSDATIEARRAEDDRAFSGTAARTRRFDGLEGAYASPERRRDDLVMFDTALREWLADHPSGTVLVPAGAGVRVADSWYSAALRKARRARSNRPTSPSEEPLPRGDEDTHGVGSGHPAPTVPARAGHLAASRARALAAPGLRMLTQAGRTVLHQSYLRRRRRATRRGMGSNPDHLALRDHALALLEAHPGIEVLAYEELPYSWHQSARAELDDIESSGTWDVEEIVVPVDRELKARHLAAYTSQLPVLDPQGRLMQAGTLPSTERYWRLERR